MTQHTPTENPMAKALADADYFLAGSIAADEINRLEAEITQLRQDKAELVGAMELAQARLRNVDPKGTDTATYRTMTAAIANARKEL